MGVRTDRVNATVHRWVAGAMSAGSAAPWRTRLSRWPRASLIAAAFGCVSASQVAAQATGHEAVTPAEALRVPAVSWHMPHTMATPTLLPNVGSAAHAALQSFHAAGRQEPERFRMLLPVIGAVAGAGVGYLYARRSNTPDTYVPTGLFSIPVGALAGFVVGIVAEDIRSQVKDDGDRER